MKTNTPHVMIATQDLDPVSGGKEAGSFINVFAAPTTGHGDVFSTNRFENLGLFRNDNGGMNNITVQGYALNTGNMVIEQGGSLSVGRNAEFVNHGTINTAGEIRVGDGGRLLNGVDATIDNGTGAILETSGYLENRGGLVNAPGASFTNRGYVEIGSNSLAVNNDYLFNSGSAVLDGRSLLYNDGHLRIDGGDIALDGRGVLNNTHSLNVDGAVNIDGRARFDNTGEAIVTGTVDLRGTGGIQNDGDLGIQGLFNNRDATFNNAERASFNLGENGWLVNVGGRIENSEDAVVDGILVNAGKTLTNDLSLGTGEGRVETPVDGSYKVDLGSTNGEVDRIDVQRVSDPDIQDDIRGGDDLQLD